MDSAWVVVIGAAVGAFGSFGGVALTSWLVERREDKRERRRQLLVVIEAILERTARASFQRDRGSVEYLERSADGMALVAKFATLVPKGGDDVPNLVIAAWNAMRNDPGNEPKYAAAVLAKLPA
ncbi:hypothetical protein GCM10027413_07380 [Conyzicola nivalis]|uniref:Uncharacterized protein n=1 Tax=Conyzicola nivalis TaxID=1477021 RepID=A0A916WJT6_9MICO|nr:hypothetical protein [Conyzicola nivalis]GGB04696.1 hypothetical protein GCM10010979_19250 [Conyzicola nivalis]